jgi:hypothetical protein
MSGWLPPGCTDADIDREINGDGSESQCDCCGKMFPIEQLNFIRFGHPNSNAPCDTAACRKCCGEDEEE